MQIRQDIAHAHPGFPVESYVPICGHYVGRRDAALMCNFKVCKRSFRNVSSANPAGCHLLFLEERVISRSARLGTAIRGYQLPRPVQMDTLEARVDGDLEEDLQSEAATVFEKAWNPIPAHPDRSLSVPSTWPAAEEDISTAHVVPEGQLPITPRAERKFVTFAHDSDTDSDDQHTPTPVPRPVSDVFDPSTRQSNTFRLGIVGSRRGPCKGMSPLQSGRKVS